MSEVFRIKRKIEIDTAHRVPDHASKCYNLHGHRYVIEAVCKGQLFKTGEQSGMVMDFGFLKECMMTAIHDPCDHATVLWRNDPLVDVLTRNQCPSLFVAGRIAYTGNGVKLVLMNNVPTAENLAKLWFVRLREQISTWFMATDTDTIPQLESIHVYETPNCVAWFNAEDYNDDSNP